MNELLDAPPYDSCLNMFNLGSEDEEDETKKMKIQVLCRMGFGNEHEVTMEISLE